MRVSVLYNSARQCQCPVLQCAAVSVSCITVRGSVSVLYYSARKCHCPVLQCTVVSLSCITVHYSGVLQFSVEVECTHGVRQPNVTVGVVRANAVDLVRVAGFLHHHRAGLYRFWSAGQREKQLGGGSHSQRNKEERSV